ncbi:MAG: single-stranded DNA-binding protein [Oscillospiraceae bacterium]|nr:single-stranded DNA-binding protein [Oscillospiraceae bacterium]
MEQLDTANNIAILCGTAPQPPKFSHTGGAEDYVTFPLEIERLSGAVDRINIVARAAAAEKLEFVGSPRLYIVGEVRSFNNKSGEGSRLVITVFARELRYAEAADENSVHLRGALCKPPTLRRTPMGRLICDVMLAVNRRYGRSDYLPCIAWGRIAQELSARTVGDVIEIDGRIQSRGYIKTTPDGSEERTAYEVSVISLTGEGA